MDCNRVTWYGLSEFHRQFRVRRFAWWIGVPLVAGRLVFVEYHLHNRSNFPRNALVRWHILARRGRRWSPAAALADNRIAVVYLDWFNDKGTILHHLVALIINKPMIILQIDEKIIFIMFSFFFLYIPLTNCQHQSRQYRRVSLNEHYRFDFLGSQSIMITEAPLSPMSLMLRPWTLFVKSLDLIHQLRSIWYHQFALSAFLGEEYEANNSLGIITFPTQASHTVKSVLQWCLKPSTIFAFPSCYWYFSYDRLRMTCGCNWNQFIAINRIDLTFGWW